MPTNHPDHPSVVLASSSPYRRQLLERLRIPFTVHSPNVDETQRPNEDSISLVHRLSRIKAEAVAQRYPNSIIIGSDQVAVSGTAILGKPGSVEAARAQLKAASGLSVIFHTGVHVLDPFQHRYDAHVDATTVRFRNLSSDEIERYVAVEKPLDCAGAFKAEALGISLFERIDTQDPTALTGLPLIWLAGALRRAGLQLP